MADYLVTGEEIAAIADKVRAKMESTEDIKWENMPSAIDAVYEEGRKSVGEVLKFTDVSSSAYRSTVPNGVEPFARVSKIGGMTYKTDDGLRSASVNELKSEGANLMPSQEYGVHIPLVLKANTQYVVSVANPVSANMQLLFYDNNKTRFSNVAVSLEDANTDRRYRTFTLSQDCAYIMWAWASVTTVNEGQIEYGSIPSKYKPYIGTLDTLAIPETVKSLDGYGWGVNAEYNNHIVWRNGRVYFVKMVNKVDAGTLNWGLINDETYPNRFGVAISDINRTSGGHILDGYTNKGVVGYGSGLAEDKSFGNAGNQVNVHNSAYSTSAEFKQGMQGVMFYYVLAEPIETDISAYLTDEYIEVEGGGTITAVNEYEYDVPSKISYLIDTQGG